MSRLLVSDAEFPVGCLLRVPGTLQNAFFGPGGANWGSLVAQKGEMTPSIPASPNQPIPSFHSEPRRRVPLGSKQHGVTGVMIPIL